jgi:hypothetical protein
MLAQFEEFSVTEQEIVILDDHGVLSFSSWESIPRLINSNLLKQVIKSTAWESIPRRYRVIK